MPAILIIGLLIGATVGEKISEHREGRVQVTVEEVREWVRR